MGLKINKKHFFHAYSDLKAPKTIRSHQKRVKVLPLGSHLGRSFSLSHRLKDLFDLIKTERNSQDKRRLIEIGKFIYLNESQKHFCLMNLLFAIRNALLGRGFCTAKKIYRDIEKEQIVESKIDKPSQTNKQNPYPQKAHQKNQQIHSFKEMWENFLTEVKGIIPKSDPETKILTGKKEKLFPKKIPPLDPNIDLFFKDFNNNFIEQIKPLAPKDIEQYTQERKAPFNIFYSPRPEEERLTFIGKNLSSEQLFALQRGLFFQSSQVLCNYCLCIHARQDKSELFQGLMEFLKAEDLLVEMPELSDLIVSSAENKEKALIAYSEHYIRLALKEKKITDCFALLNHFHQKDSLLMYLSLMPETSNFMPSDLPDREKKRFFIWSRKNIPFNKSITPYYFDMSSKRFNAVIQRNKENGEVLAEVFGYLHHTPRDSNDNTRFGKNFKKAMPLFSNEEIGRLAEEDFFKLNDTECSKWKLDLMASALTTGQFLNIIEGSSKLGDSLLLFKNLAYATAEMVGRYAAISKMQNLFQSEIWSSFFLKYSKEDAAKTFASSYLMCMLKGADSSKLINCLDQLANLPPLLTSLLNDLEINKVSAAAKITLKAWVNGKQWEEEIKLKFSM